MKNQACCKPQQRKEIEKLREIEVDESDKIINNNTETIEKKNSSTNLMNDYLREKQNQIIEQNTKNEFNEHSIFDNTKKSQYGKILYVSPPLTFPNLFLNHKDIIIDEFGLQGIPRENKGKLTFFGIDPKYLEGKSNSHANDIIISDEITNPKINKTHAIFYIYFDQKYNHYFLKSLSKDIYFSLVFNPYIQITLDSNHKNYIKIGKVILSILIKNDEKIIYIKIKKGETIDKEQNYFFHEDKMPITIGRGNCSINIKCETVSKTHVTIDYDKINENFFLIDNASTNGTQLLLNEGKNIQLQGEMNFNLGEKQFSIVEKKNL